MKNKIDTRKLELALNNLAAIQEQTKQLKRQEKYNRDILIDSGLGELETDLYLCKITQFDAKRIDYKTIMDKLKIKLSPQMLRANTKISHQVKITINQV